ncbi:MAG: cytochrome c oxidase subunit 3 [Acidimicrobiia bacterium]|nr:cytochrome c oxidase subunit 3 [Acidimicrobiia bacterium]
MASAWAATAFGMAFAGMLGIYLQMRSATLADGGEWLGDVTIPLTPPNVMMATLVMSAVTAHWAHYAIVRNDRVNAYVAMGLTIVFGVAFVNSQGFLYSQMGLVVADSAQAMLVYAITGTYLAMLGIAMLYLAVTAFRALGGQFTPTQHDTVTGAVLFWDATVAIFGFIWIAIYIAK